MPIVAVVVFLIDLAPAFTPPTWSILAFFAITFGWPLLPLAIAATAPDQLPGRCSSRRWHSTQRTAWGRASRRSCGIERPQSWQMP